LLVSASLPTQASSNPSYSTPPLQSLLSVPTLHTFFATSPPAIPSPYRATLLYSPQTAVYYLFATSLTQRLLTTRYVPRNPPRPTRHHHHQHHQPVVSVRPPRRPPSSLPPSLPLSQTRPMALPTQPPAILCNPAHRYFTPSKPTPSSHESSYRPRTYAPTTPLPQLASLSSRTQSGSPAPAAPPSPLYLSSFPTHASSLHDHSRSLMLAHSSHAPSRQLSARCPRSDHGRWAPSSRLRRPRLD